MFGLEKSPEELINVCAEKRERMSLSVVILKLSVHHGLFFTIYKSSKYMKRVYPQGHKATGQMKCFLFA